MHRILRPFQIIIVSMSLAFVISLASTGLLSPVVHAAASDAKGAVCAGVNQGGGTCSGTGAQISKVVATVVNILSVVVGMAAVIMIIISGLKYVTSSGDASSIASAKNSLLYAIVGLVVVGLAQAIVKFVLSKAKS